MKDLLAQNPFTLPGTIRGIGPYGLNGYQASSAPTLFNRILTVTVGLLTLIAGVWFLFTLLSGAIQWIGAGADKGALEEARKKILTGVIGITVVVASIFIIDIIGGLLGFADILDPGAWIPQLSP
jgi:hypothetical protein